MPLNARVFNWIALIALIALAAAAPWLASAYQLNLLGRFLSLAILALGLVLLWGEGGVLSLGQGVFFGLGGYALAMHLKLNGLSPGELPDFMTWSGRDSLPWWWAAMRHPLVMIGCVLLFPGLFGAFFSWLMFRRRISGVYFALITQALSLCFATLLISQQGLTGGFNGLTDFQTLFGFSLDAPGAPRAIYWATVAALAGAFFMTQRLRTMRYGQILRATRDGENRIRFLGYNSTPYKVVAFAFAAFLAGVAGAFFTLHSGSFSPALVGVTSSIEMVIWVAIGGRNSLWGAVSGTLLVNFAKDWISSALPSLWLYMLGALFIFAVMVLPHGLAGLGTQLKSLYRPRRAAALSKTKEGEQ